MSEMPLIEKHHAHCIGGQHGIHVSKIRWPGWDKYAEPWFGAVFECHKEGQLLPSTMPEVRGVVSKTYYACICYENHTEIIDRVSTDYFKRKEFFDSGIINRVFTSYRAAITMMDLPLGAE